MGGWVWPGEAELSPLMAGCDLGKAEAFNHPSAPGLILSGLFAEEGGPLSMGICRAFETWWEGREGLWVQRLFWGVRVYVNVYM